MSHLINVADDVYRQLTELKKARDESYSELLRQMLSQKNVGKTIGWNEMISKTKERDVRFAGKSEKIDHDKVAYGVSRDSS